MLTGTAPRHLRGLGGCKVRSVSALVLAFCAALLLAMIGVDKVHAACAPNNNDAQCASFTVIANEQHTIVDVRQKRSSSIIYLYRVCASHGTFDVRSSDATFSLGPGDCVDLDVAGGQTVVVTGRGDLAAGEYLLLHVSN